MGSNLCDDTRRRSQAGANFGLSASRHSEVLIHRGWTVAEDWQWPQDFLTLEDTGSLGAPTPDWTLRVATNTVCSH